jgi:hypothetical protein
MVARQGGGFVAVVLFVGLAALQQRQQTFGAAVLSQVVDLLLVMHIHKGLDGCDGAVYRALAEQRGQHSGQPTSHAPGHQQATAK